LWWQPWLRCGHGCTVPEKPVVLPAGEVQLTDRQLASLTIEPARGDDGIERTGATGQIAVDETRSTPVFLPYSGQILKVFVENGAHVATGDPLLRIRTGDIVDARNAPFSAEAQRSAASSQVRRRKTQRAPNRSITMPVALSKTCSRHAATSSMRSQPCGSLIRRSGPRVTSWSCSASAGRNLAARSCARHCRASRRNQSARAIGGVVVTRSVASGQYVTSGGRSPHSSSPTCRKSGWWRKWLKPMRRAYSSAIMSRLPRPRCRAANSMR
jgi:cobalt-zinc-cadmium efflux system membrane fusion protein